MTHLNWDLVLGEGPAAKELVDTVDGQVAGDVSVQVLCDSHVDSV